MTYENNLNMLKSDGDKTNNKKHAFETKKSVSKVTKGYDKKTMPQRIKYQITMKTLKVPSIKLL